MSEIKLFYDYARKNEIVGKIMFEKVKAGETSTRKIYIYNTTKWPVDVTLNVIGVGIALSNQIYSLQPRETKEVEFSFTPKLTVMKPIEAALKVKINYVIT